MQDVKMKDQTARHENAGRENAGMKMQDMKMQDRKMKDRCNTTHRQFTRKVEFNDRQEHRNSNNILITNLPMIQ